MKIFNLSYRRFSHKDPASWISGFRFFYGPWEQLAQSNEITFAEFIDHEGTVRYNGIRFWFLRRSAAALIYPFSLHRKIKKERPDVVVIHGLEYPLQVLLLRLQMPADTRIVIQHHAEQPFRNPVKVAIQKMADRIVDCYFFAGKGLAASWVKTGQINDARKVRELMEGSSFFSALPKDEARARTGMAARDSYLWVGHLNANKNPLLVVRAFLRFAARFNPGAELYMIFQSNQLLEEVKILLAAQPNLSASVHLLGKMEHPELQYWFSASDYFISGSAYESCGMAACEAMSCGCIPVLSDIPSFRFMTGGRCGILYEEGNEDALIDALKQSLTMNKEIERQKVLQQFQEQLSFEATARKIQAVLCDL